MSSQQRTIVITGASDGIGASAAAQLAHTDARVIVVGRSPEKTAAVAKRIGAEYFIADFMRLDDVRVLAEQLNNSCERIDVLANNAGGIFEGPVISDDGFEKTFQINHLAPYLLTNLLLNKLLSSNATVVNTSSIASRIFSDVDFDDFQSLKNFQANKAYGNAKLANILFTKALHDRFYVDGLKTVAFHPGVVATNFAADSQGMMQRVYHGVLNRFLATPKQGGARLVHFIEGAVGQDWRSGQYYGRPGHIGTTNKVAYEPDLVEKHWHDTATMLGISW